MNTSTKTFMALSPRYHPMHRRTRAIAILTTGAFLLTSCKKSPISTNHDEPGKAPKPSSLWLAQHHSVLKQFNVSDENLSDARSKIPHELLKYFNLKSLAYCLGIAAKHPDVISGKSSALDQAIVIFNESMAVFHKHVEQSAKKIKPGIDSVDRLIHSNNDATTRAWAYLATGDLKYASQSVNPQSSLEVQAALTQTKNFAEAEALLFKIHQDDPSHAWAIMRLASEYLRNGLNEQFKAYMDLAVKLPKASDPKIESDKITAEYLKLNNLPPDVSSVAMTLEAPDDSQLYYSALKQLKQLIENGITSGDNALASRMLSTALELSKRLEESPKVADVGMAIYYQKELHDQYGERVSTDANTSSTESEAAELRRRHTEVIDLLTLQSTISDSYNIDPNDSLYLKYTEMRQSMSEIEALRALLKENK